MKSRMTLRLLCAAVAIVWGIVAWKILKPRPHVCASVGVRAPSAPPANEDDTLYADYPDPFLKEPAESAVRNETASAGRPEPPAPKPRMRIDAEHRGTIEVAGRSLYILYVNGKPYEAYSGERFAGCAVCGSDADSVYLECDGNRYGIKRVDP